MTKIVESIWNKDYLTARKLLEDRATAIMERKLLELKKIVASNMFSEMDLSSFKPDYASIEDKRGTQKPVQDGKGDLQVPQKSTSELKTDKQVTK